MAAAAAITSLLQGSAAAGMSACVLLGRVRCGAPPVTQPRHPLPAVGVRVRVRVQEVDWTRPTAFVLGNERRGVSDEAVRLADVTVVSSTCMQRARSPCMRAQRHMQHLAAWRITVLICRLQVIPMSGDNWINAAASVRWCSSSAPASNAPRLRALPQQPRARPDSLSC